MQNLNPSTPSQLDRVLGARFARLGATALLCIAGQGLTTTVGQAQPLEDPVSNAMQTAAPITGPLAIMPMTTIGKLPLGYFQDPYPVHLDRTSGSRTAVFSGTTKAVMACTYPISARCFSWTPVSIDAGTLAARITDAGSFVTNFQNLNVFQDDTGRWHAVVAIDLSLNSGGSDHWTVLAHAHPTVDTPPGSMPLSWSADTVLSGSLSTTVQGNYDGKYFFDNGQLYLLYVKNYVPEPALRNEIVIQRLLTPTQLAPEDPIVLLSPGDRYGTLNSEWYDHTPAKLVEAPYIAKIRGKYALIYSTGAFEHVDYKTGVAWSDTLIPPANGRYRKVLQADPNRVWGQADQPEVHYLLQSQHAAWPNFTADQVIGPGVASAVQDPNGVWRLYFAGYDPTAPHLLARGVNDPRYRRPYFVQLHVSVPADLAVSAATDAELANWLEPGQR